MQNLLEELIQLLSEYQIGRNSGNPGTLPGLQGDGYASSEMHKEGAGCSGFKAGRHERN